MWNQNPSRLPSFNSMETLSGILFLFPNICYFVISKTSLLLRKHLFLFLRAIFLKHTIIAISSIMKKVRSISRMCILFPSEAVCSSISTDHIYCLYILRCVAFNKNTFIRINSKKLHSFLQYQVSVKSFKISL